MTKFLPLVVLGGVTLGGIAVATSARESATSHPLLFFSDANPVELGAVSWNRDYNEAASLAREGGKPLFILFQEVPGCATCRNYGTQVLSHPLVVDAIENSFVATCIYNNTRGDADHRVLVRFGERAWNNPVVRIVDADGKSIVPRIENDWSLSTLVHSMVAALEARERRVPPYLELLSHELGARRHGVATAVFGMPCYWSGEAKFGGIEGVISTRSGWLGGTEVVQLEYDSRIVRYEEILEAAKESGFANCAFPRNDAELQVVRQHFGDQARRETAEVRVVKDTKYYLTKTKLRFVPMTELQATRINRDRFRLGGANIPNGAPRWLSPRQLELLAFIEKNANAGWKEVLGVDLTTAWQEVSERRRLHANP